MARVAAAMAAVAMAIAAGASADAAPPSLRTAAAAPCRGDYADRRGAPPRRLRFGIDPAPAGIPGSVQPPVSPAQGDRDLAALRRLRAPGRELVVRLNRLFESDGDAGIRRFRRLIAVYARAGFDVELQVRYHPSPAQAGDMAAWTAYVRRVVDRLADDRRVVALTITNEVNVAASPNTSDGAYPDAEQALIRGIVAAHREAVRRGIRWLRLGFAYAAGFDPAAAAAMFAGLRDAGAGFRAALGFVGVDYYPELDPGPSVPIRAATLQMLGTVRGCLMALAGLGRRVPIWITETGYDSGAAPGGAVHQRSALSAIIDTVAGAAGTYGVTDVRWFDLRDNRTGAAGFAQSTGLLTDRYAPKAAFAAYARLIRRYGAPDP